MSRIKLPRVLSFSILGVVLLLLPPYAVTQADMPSRVDDLHAVSPRTERVGQGQPGASVAATTQSELTPSDLSCRYGVSAFSPAEKSWLPTLHAGWYHNFSARTETPPDTIEFVQVLRIRQNKDGCTYLDGYSVNPPLTEAGLGAVIRNHLGALWIVGNEPDRGPNPENCLGPVQDDTYPEVYARVYHDAYYFIKERDPSAQLAIAGLVEVTPGRLQYLDKVWAAYQQRYGATMPVDVWNMHLYILPEALPNGQPNGIANVALGTDIGLAIRESDGDPTRCSDPNVYCYAEHDSLTVFAEQVVAMRTWMKDHGQRDRPLYLSEYSILYPFQDYDDPVNPTQCFLQDEYGGCFTQARVTQFMTRTFSYLESAVNVDLGYVRDQNRLVQRWLWYTMYTDALAYVSSLTTSDASALTGVGQIYAGEYGLFPHYVNVAPDAIPPSRAFLSPPAATVDVPLQAYVSNYGDIRTTAPFTVTFYADSALTQPIGAAVIPTDLGGCGRSRWRVSVIWPGLTLGQHPFWVKADSTGVIGESDETDNVASGMVIVSPSGTFLPYILRRSGR